LTYFLLTFFVGTISLSQEEVFQQTRTNADSLSVINRSDKSIKKNSIFTIVAEIKSRYTILAVVAFYRFDGESEWNMIRMYETDNNSYTTEVVVEDKGLEYYVMAIDKSLYHPGKIGNKSKPVKVQIKREIVSINTLFKFFLFGSVIGLMILNFKL